MAGRARRAGLRLLLLALTTGATLLAAEGRTGQSWWAVPGDGHPGAEAHALAGRETAGFVERLIAAEPR